MTSVGRPVEIAFFTHFSGIVLGGERNLLDLLNSLEGQYRFTIFARSNGESLREHLDQRLDLTIFDVDYSLYPYMIVDDQSVRVGPVRFVRFLRWFVTEQWRALRDIRSKLRGRRIDVVHTLTTAVAVGSLYSRRERKPHVWHAQETVAYCGLPQRFWLSYMDRTADVIVGISQRTARDYGRKAIVINNGIQVDRVATAFEAADPESVRREFGVDENALVICCIGTLQPGKGQDVLVRALHQLVEGRPAVPIQVFLLGPAGASGRYAEYAQQLRASIAELDLGSSVHLTGYRSDYLDFVKLADLCVHPATLDDSYPAAVRDPMVCGRAVIASSTGGIPEMIEHGVTGLLVPPGDVNALASAIAQLARSPAERGALASRAMVFARQHFDARRMAAEMETIYARLIA